MSDFTAAIPTFVPGELAASDLDTLADLATALTDDWTSYTPVWSTSGTAPSLGAGTLIGRQKIIGLTLDFFLRLTWAADTTGGTGTWRFTLPASPNLGNWTAAALIYDNSTGIPYPAAVRLVSASPHVDRLGAHTAAGASGIVTATQPVTWATSDALAIVGRVKLS